MPTFSSLPPILPHSHLHDVVGFSIFTKVEDFPELFNEFPELLGFVQGNWTILNASPSAVELKVLTKLLRLSISTLLICGELTFMFSGVKNAVFRFFIIPVTAIVAALCLGMNNLAFSQGVIVNPTTDIHPLGYAYVRANGSIIPERSRNITAANVVNNGSGIYGFRNLSFTPRNIQVTLAFDTQAVTGDNRTGARAFVGDCSFINGLEQACVSINSDPDIASTTRDDFFVVFY